MSDNLTSPRRGRDLYWRELVQLVTSSIYWRRYRDDRSKWVSRLGTLRAIASSGSIGAWVIWRDYALIWAAIIAASQVADALKNVFPFSREYKSANEHMLALDRILIDTELEWIRVFNGDYPEDQILERRRALMLLQHEAARRNFPDGSPRRNDHLWAIAEEEAIRYLKERYATEGNDG
jgi:hypothetical protein